MKVCEQILGGICTLIAEDQGGKICRGQGFVFIGVGHLDNVSGLTSHSLWFYLGVTSRS